MSGLTTPATTPIADGAADSLVKHDEPKSAQPETPITAEPTPVQPYGKFGSDPTKLYTGYQNLEKELSAAKSELSLSNQTLQQVAPVLQAMTEAKKVIQPTIQPAEAQPSQGYDANAESFVAGVVKKELAPLTQELNKGRVFQSHPEMADQAFALKVREFAATLPMDIQETQTKPGGASFIISLYKESLKGPAQPGSPEPHMEAQIGRTTTPGSVSGPAYSAEKISELRRNNPAEYRVREQDIYKAYQEGRVK